MLRLWLGSVCVALVLWAWSTVFYVISPVPYYTMSETTGADDVAAGQALKQIFPESGTYILPGRYADDETRSLLRSQGPVATVYIKREGFPEASVRQVLIGTFNSIVIGLLLGGAMIMLRKYTQDYWSHVAIGSTFGIAYTAYPRFADIIWSAFPPGYQLMMIFSDGFSWILITMVMAWFVVPRKA
ncbi:MAG: hypothetical protein ACR2QG_05390 [Gammaproteobacteria bacterium]